MTGPTLAGREHRAGNEPPSLSCVSSVCRSNMTFPVETRATATGTSGRTELVATNLGAVVASIFVALGLLLLLGSVGLWLFGAILAGMAKANGRRARSW